MDFLSWPVLVIALLALIMISGFFSGSEIGMMALNRYRLRHLVKKQNKRAIRVNRLIQHPDKLLGVILIGNTFANILASALATILAVKLFGDIGVAIATILLTLIILIFAEMAPKTLSALYPERIAFVVAWPLSILQYLMSPLVWLTNFAAKQFLRLCGVNLKKMDSEHLSGDELRTVVLESGNLIPERHKQMLLGILDLEKVTIDDIMVPRNEIVGIDLNESLSEIIKQINHSQHTRLPLYTENINDVHGMIHLRSTLRLLESDDLTKEALLDLAEAIYFIPEAIPLYQQLIYFQKAKCRSALVVDEYGDVQGLVTLEDILEEVVGEFTTDMASVSKDIMQQTDGSVVVDGSTTIRELNRAMKWKLPSKGPKTLNGIIVEYLEFIPPAGTCLKINNYVIEILQVKDNAIKTVRIQKNSASL